MNKLMIGAASIALLAGGAAIAASPSLPTVPRYGSWGIDLAARDTRVAPGDDFDLYANGTGKAALVIADDETSAGPGRKLRNLVIDQSKAMVVGAPAGSQVGDLYRSFIDEAAVEALDAKPLKADLDALNAVTNRQGFTRLLGSAPSSLYYGLMDFGPYADPAAPTVNRLWLGQSGLGLPSRDYYLKDEFKTQREAYRAYIGRALGMAGAPNPAAAADKVMAFETAIARVSWSPEQSRDLARLNNPMTLAELVAYAPGLDWKTLFEAAGVTKPARIIVATKEPVRDIAALYAATPLETLKLWQAFHLTDRASPYLSKRFVDSKFALDTVIDGVSVNRPRWKRGVALADGTLGEVIGKDYLAATFPAESKALMTDMIARLKLAMAGRIKSNDWMAPATKAAALDKLARMTVMVGGPDKPRDYSALIIRPDDLYGNVKRSAAADWAYYRADVDQPVDRARWSMTPQTVNAYNGGLENKIVFPAGFLQPPHLDPKADPAVNYGAVGSVIGHEISHGFDDQGRKIDAMGRLRDWWTPADAARFEAAAKVFGAQYDRYEPVAGSFINGKLTMGENIADLAGALIALDAYHASLNGKPAPVIDGLTGDQRFFLSFAQMRRNKVRDDSTRKQLASDPHSPSRFRIIGPVRNIDAWYEAFAVKPGAKYYLAPKDRVRIW